MFPLIEAKQSSGMSGKEFCRLHQLPEHIFYYWQRRYREQLESMDEFVQIDMQLGSHAKMRLNLGSGRSLEFNGSVSARWMGELIREIES